MSFLCSIGLHKLHPAKITLSQEHYAATGAYLRQCLRCGCILARKDKPAAGVMASAPAQPCKRCHGEGCTNEGDPEIGNAYFECTACGGTGKEAARPGYTEGEVAALNEDERRNGPYGVSEPDGQTFSQQTPSEAAAQPWKGDSAPR